MARTGETSDGPPSKLEIFSVLLIISIPLLCVVAFAILQSIDSRKDLAAYERHIDLMAEERARPKPGLFERCYWETWDTTTRGNWACHSLFDWYEWEKLMEE